MNDDLISRQAAIKQILLCENHDIEHDFEFNEGLIVAMNAIDELPTAEPTLYGYKIEHLAYIATVMEKEGVTAEYAVRTFDDMERVIKMVIEEARAKIEETFNG